jgi:hypothetical protein
MSPVNRDIYFLLFQSGWFLFLFPSLIALARTTSVTLNKSCQIKHFCQVSDINDKTLILSQVSMILIGDLNLYSLNVKYSLTLGYSDIKYHPNKNGYYG